MSNYPINDISISSDRHKLYVLLTNPEEVNTSISFIHSQKIPCINIGKELALYIDSLEDFSYLNLDVYEHTKKLLENNKAKINNSGNDVIAIYNFGILLEPSLELNASKLLKEFAKLASLIIIWENKIEDDDVLKWPTQNDNYLLDFSDTPLKKLQYAI